MLELSSECLHRNGLVSILDVRYVWRKQREEYHEEHASAGRKKFACGYSSLAVYERWNLGGLVGP